MLRYKRMIWLRVSTNRLKWLSTGFRTSRHFFIYERIMHDEIY
jgi:hypothetical protein